MNSGNTILIDASQSQLGREVSEIYGRTITALAQSYAFLRARNDQKKYCPVFFIIDEASTFISSDLETILTQARKFGLHLILANQIVKQGGMSAELHEAIMGNTALKIVGNAGHSTKTAMTAEMELEKNDLKSLSVGTFVVKADGKRPQRVRLPSFWLGKSQLCNDEEWERAKQILLRAYYPKARTFKARPSQKNVRHRRPMPTKPKFGIPSPFDRRFMSLRECARISARVPEL